MSKNNARHAKKRQTEYDEIIRTTKKKVTTKNYVVISYKEARDRLKNHLLEDGKLRIDDYHE